MDQSFKSERKDIYELVRSHLPMPTGEQADAALGDPALVDLRRRLFEVANAPAKRVERLAAAYAEKMVAMELDYRVIHHRARLRSGFDVDSVAPGEEDLLLRALTEMPEAVHPLTVSLALNRFAIASVLAGDAETGIRFYALANEIMVAETTAGPYLFPLLANCCIAIDLEGYTQAALWFRQMTKDAMAEGDVGKVSLTLLEGAVRNEDVTLITQLLAAAIPIYSESLGHTHWYYAAWAYYHASTGNREAALRSLGIGAMPAPGFQTLVRRRALSNAVAARLHLAEGNLSEAKVLLERSIRECVGPSTHHQKLELLALDVKRRSMEGRWSEVIEYSWLADAGLCAAPKSEVFESLSEAHGALGATETSLDCLRKAIEIEERQFAPIEEVASLGEFPIPGSDGEPSSRVGAFISSQTEALPLIGDLARKGDPAVADGDSASRIRRFLHDVRTPLTSLRFWANLDADPESGRARMGTVEQLVARIRELTSELALHFSVPMPVPVPASDILVRLVEEFGPLGQEKEVRLECSQETELVLLTEPVRFLGAIANLVHNAMKFSPPGGVVQIRVEPVSEAFVSFAILDSGPGFGPQGPGNPQQPSSDQTVRPDRKGKRRSGLGLPLSVGRLRTLGGSLDLENRPGGTGAVVTVTVPRASGQLLMRLSSPRGAQEHRRSFRPQPANDGVGRQPSSGIVLIVEDDPILCHLLTSGLAERGYEVKSATTIDGAQELAYSETPWDCVVCDLFMGGVSFGFDFLQAVLRDGESRSALLMSGRIDRSLREIIQAGPIRFLPKPFPIESLADHLDLCIEKVGRS